MKRQTGVEPSSLSASFRGCWAVLYGPPLEAEVLFAQPRKWRFDFAHSATHVAIELEGGVWSGGRHIQPAGFEADCEKYNAAAALGWFVFRVTRVMLRENPVGTLTPIIETIVRRTQSE